MVVRPSNEPRSGPAAGWASAGACTTTSSAAARATGGPIREGTVALSDYPVRLPPLRRSTATDHRHSRVVRAFLAPRIRRASTLLGLPGAAHGTSLRTSMTHPDWVAGLVELPSARPQGRRPKSCATPRTSSGSGGDLVAVASRPGRVKGHRRLRDLAAATAIQSRGDANGGWSALDAAELAHIHLDPQGSYAWPSALRPTRRPWGISLTRHLFLGIY
jgi:hypothetical protein